MQVDSFKKIHIRAYMLVHIMHACSFVNAHKNIYVALLMFVSFIKQRKPIETKQNQEEKKEKLWIFNCEMLVADVHLSEGV